MKTALPSLLLLAGCAGGIQAPSLAPRPFEQKGEAPAPPPATAVAPGVDPAVAQQAAALRTQAEAADREFVQAIAAAERTASGPAGSEAWVARQTAVSAAEVARAPARDALSAFDDLIAKLAASDADPTTVLPLHDAVQSIVTRQNERLAALNQR